MRRVDALLLLFSAFVPLATLLLVSMLLVELKRRPSLSPWLTRLAAPPFYMVSLPIATLVVGAGMLGMYLLIISAGYMSRDGFSWYFWSEFFFLNPFPIPFFGISFLRPAIIFFFGCFWVIIFVSGYLVWQTVRCESDRRPSPRVANQLLPGLLLLITFAWAHMYMVTHFAYLMTPLGVSTSD